MKLSIETKEYAKMALTVTGGILLAYMIFFLFALF
jgi:hypothetical protein